MTNIKTNIDQDLLRQIDSLRFREIQSEIIEIALEECLDSSCLEKMELKEFQEIGLDQQSISQLTCAKKCVILEGGRSIQNLEIEEGNNQTEKRKYGELILLGHHQHQGPNPQSLFSLGFSRERFQLWLKSENNQRPDPGTIIFRPNLMMSDGNRTQIQEVKTFPEYDSSTVDIYQIGRCESGSNDWIMRGIPPEGDNGSHGKCKKDSISRYSCRIVCDRDPPYRCRIYAGGFNSVKELVLPTSSLQWRNADSTFDGLPGSGIYLWHPNHRSWNEVTVRGHILERRRMEGTTMYPGARKLDRTNELVHGSIIDIGGCLIYFQSSDFPTVQESTGSIIKMLNDLQPQCPVLFQSIQFNETPTLKIKQRRFWEYLKNSQHQPVCSRNPNGTESENDDNLQPYVYAACGHVYGHSRELEGRACPLCRKMGPYVPLLVCLDQSICSKIPTHVFNPCGHAASLQICRQWSQTPLPDLVKKTKAYAPRCPFCLM